MPNSFGKKNEKKKTIVEVDNILGPDSNKNTRELIESRRGLLSFLGNIKYKNFESKKVQQELEVLVTGMLQKQTEAIQYKMMVELDVEKKIIFTNYMERVQTLNEEIIASSRDGAKRLTQIVVDNVEDIYLMKKSIKSKFKKLVDDGVMTKKEYKKEIKKNNIALNRLMENCEIMVELILTNHAQAFERTVTLFDHTVIKRL